MASEIPLHYEYIHFTKTTYQANTYLVYMSAKLRKIYVIFGLSLVRLMEHLAGDVNLTLVHLSKVCTHVNVVTGTGHSIVNNYVKGQSQLKKVQSTQTTAENICYAS